MRPTILFLCPHGAAKSVLAAAYCQQLASEKGLDWQVTSAGTEPDAVVAPAIIELLQDEDLEVGQLIPRRVTPEELAAAWRVISLGCDLGELAPPGKKIEHWDDVPPPSQNLPAARAAIYAHVEQLIAAV